MADDGGGLGFAIAALIDVLVGESAKRKRWVRIASTMGTLLFLGLIAAAVYVTFKYST